MSPGGPERIRTADLLIANEALYQLSYRPVFFWAPEVGLEPTTLSFTGRRSTIELLRNIEITLAFYQKIKKKQF